MTSVAFLREPNKMTVSLKDSIHLKRIGVMKTGGVIVVMVKGDKVVVVDLKVEVVMKGKVVAVVTVVLGRVVEVI